MMMIKRDFPDADHNYDVDDENKAIEEAERKEMDE